VNGSVVKDEEGKPLYFLGYIRDISARKEAELARDRLVDILEATPDFVGTATPDGRTLYINRAGRELVARPEGR
jgi:PAS domain-containing protein